MQGLFSSSSSLFICLVLFSVHPAWGQKSDWEHYQKHGHTSPKWDPLVEAGLDTFESGNVNTAISFFKRATALGCKDSLVQYKLALILEAGGGLQGALEMLETAKPQFVKQYAKHPAALEFSEHLGRLYYQLNRYDEALTQFKEAIEKQGENFLRTYLIGQIYRMRDEKEQAVVYFEKSLALPPPPESPGNMKQLARLELMQLYDALEKFDQALAMAEAILQEDPVNPVAIAYRDKIRQRQFRQGERKTWERILSQ